MTMHRIDVVLALHAASQGTGWRPVHTESSDSQIVVVLRADGNPANIEPPMLPGVES